MRVGGTRGTMQQCIAEIEDSALPQDFKLKQVRSLVRYMREVDGLVRGINSESGFEADCTAYLEILCTKEESELNRRVSCTRVLKQARGYIRRSFACITLRRPNGWMSSTNPQNLALHGIARGSSKLPGDTYAHAYVSICTRVSICTYAQQSVADVSWPTR